MHNQIKLCDMLYLFATPAQIIIINNVKKVWPLILVIAEVLIRLDKRIKIAS